MSGEIVGYYDGSEGHRDGRPVRVTLAGYAAKPQVWSEVDAAWRRVLADDSRRPRAAGLHMWQANALSDDFRLTNGWTKERVNSLLNDLSNRCLSLYGTRDPIEDSLVGAVCTVEIDDFVRAQKECPYLQGMSPHELCVNYMTEVALRLLPEDHTTPTGKTGSLEMYFDQGEKFMRTIYGPWQRHRKKTGPLNLIHRIEKANSANCIGLQAADFLAWHANRDWWKRDSGEKDLVLRMRMIAGGVLASDRYDYPKLMQRYRHRPPRDAAFPKVRRTSLK